MHSFCDDKDFREKPSDENCHNKHSLDLHLIATRCPFSMMITIIRQFITLVSFLTHYYVFISRTIYGNIHAYHTQLECNQHQTFPSFLARSRKSKPNAKRKLVILSNEPSVDYDKHQNLTSTSGVWSWKNRCRVYLNEGEYGSFTIDQSIGLFFFSSPPLLPTKRSH